MKIGTILATATDIFLLVVALCFPLASGVLLAIAMAHFMPAWLASIIGSAVALAMIWLMRSLAGKMRF